MSRTYRKGPYIPEKFTHEDVVVEEGTRTGRYYRTRDKEVVISKLRWRLYKPVPLEGKAKKEALARFKADGQNWFSWTKAPSNFRNKYATRPQRRWDNDECKRLVQSLDHEEYRFDKPRNCDWDWI